MFDEPSYRASRDGGSGPANPAAGDPDGAAVVQRIDRERLAEQLDDEAERSVFDEPSFSEVISGPIPESALRYTSWYRERSAITSRAFSWYVTLLLALASGPFAVVATLFGAYSGGLPGAFGSFAVVVLGPATEEIMKTVLIAVTLDRRPWLFRSRAQIVTVGLASGLVFAAIENALYLLVYVPNPSAELIAWRWTVCVGLHMGCAAIASIGLAQIWHRSIGDYSRPRLEPATGMLVAAMVVHGLYNLFAMVYGTFRPF